MKSILKLFFDQRGGIKMVEEKTINEIAKEWEEDKRRYVKKSTIAAYQLLIQNHISPYFGELNKVCEEDVQKFVLKKLDDGLSEKTIKDIIIVLKMILKFGVKLGYLEYVQIDVKFPTNHENKTLDILTK